MVTHRTATMGDDGSMTEPMTEPPSDRTAELTPAWMSSVLVRWDEAGDAHPLVGPGADALPGGEVLHVLTSQDPMGEAQPPARNDELLADLLASLAADPPGLWWPVTGCDPIGAHAELGVGIAGLGRAAAAELGQRWAQLAIYELEVDELRVVASQPPRLGEVLEVGPRRWDGPPLGGIAPGAIERWWAAYLRAGLAPEGYGAGTLPT
jgi:hypothetical protein